MRKRKSDGQPSFSSGPFSWIRDIAMFAVALFTAGFSELNIVRILVAILFLVLVSQLSLGRPNG